ncbi:MAG TPA: hypothetical protein VH724_15255, partial [Candidatus Angelobacter sp.]|nr:hypothetical protein [Candidatus Angelobacter sp.]
TITTTARSTAVPVPPSGIPPQFTLLLLMGLAGVLFATRIKNPRMRLATGFAGMALLCVSGCGDSKSTVPKGVNGTPAGTSAVTVTATSASGGATANSTVNLTVQ